jgi:hypothetical protein
MNTTLKHQKGSAGLWIIMIIFVGIVAGGGYYFVTKNSPESSQSNSSSSTNPNPFGSSDQNKNNIAKDEPVESKSVQTARTTTTTSIKFGDCDLSGITKLSQTNPVTGEVLQLFTVQGGKFMKIDGINQPYDATSLIKSFLCTAGGSAIDAYKTYPDFGGNTNGQWFVVGVGSRNIQANAKEIQEDGQAVIVIESRQVSTTQAGHIYINQQKILKSRGLLKSTVTMVVPGTDLMLSKTVEQIGTENPKLYIPQVWIIK